MLDIFGNSAFSVTRLALAMKDVKFVPSRVSSLGLFETTSVDTLDIAIEKAADQTLKLIPASPRGAPGVTWGSNRRTMRNLKIPHFQVDDAIMADAVQSVRAFGDEMAVQRIADKISMRAAEASQFFALNEEFHRVTVLTQGKLLDADGTTELYDYATEFGESLPGEVDFDLDNATPASGALRKKCTAVTRAMSATLDGLPYTGIHALCGDAFFDDLIAHVEVRATYAGTAEAKDLRAAYINSGASGSYGTFAFGGIVWENYRGISSVAIGTDKCHIFPLGVPGLFRTVYAPADYIETVNTMGQRLYAKQWRMPNDKGVNLEFQSNALHYCTRPRVLMRGRRT